MSIIFSKISSCIIYDMLAYLRIDINLSYAVCYTFKQLILRRAASSVKHQRYACCLIDFFKYICAYIGSALVHTVHRAYGYSQCVNTCVSYKSCRIRSLGIAFLIILASLM